MKHVTLTQIEATGIQDYVFGSNNLRQNVGASELVARATSQWVAETLDVLKLNHNAVWDESTGRLILEGKGLDAGAQAEVIYVGGGNALVLFDGLPDRHAAGFLKRLTRRGLEQARGLSLVVGQIEFDSDTVSLASQHSRLRRELAARKLARTPDVPSPGLGVTAACEFTGQPVVGRDDDGRLISQAVRHKLDAFVLADQRQHHNLRQVRARGYEFVYDFDQFGEKGESSYIAVIHADGNRMSERFAAIAAAYPLPADNANYAVQLRSLSEATNARALEALQATVDLLMQNRHKDKFGNVVPVPVREGQEYLPFRPIVFGGDDVTFVCEGRLGLALAAHYLEALALGGLPGPRASTTGDPLYARAGVAIVKSHYPFSRAYDLAEKLCQSAKEKIQALTPTGKGTVMDWHIATSGVVLPLDEVRAREYVSDQGHSLLMRPVRLDLGRPQPAESKYWRSWETFEQVTAEFQKEKWAEHRNKLKALRDAIRRGPVAVEQFRASYGQPELPLVKGQSTMSQTGWQAQDCGYWDAIEAADLYVPLKGQGGAA